MIYQWSLHQLDHHGKRLYLTIVNATPYNLDSSIYLSILDQWTYVHWFIIYILQRFGLKVWNWIMNNCKYKRLVKIVHMRWLAFFFVTVFGGLDQMFGLILWTLEHIMFNMSNIIIELFLLPLLFLGCALRNYKNTPRLWLKSRTSLKTSYRVLFL
jgi:hypothetical protein